MKHAGLKTMLVGFLAVASVNARAQIPSQITFSARLANNGVVVTGPQDFVFTLYSAQTGGSVVWTETHAAQQVTNGFVAVALGSTTALDTTVFTGSTLYLEVNVGGTTMTPRIATLSVPYAVRAGGADSVCVQGTSNCSPGLPSSAGRLGYAYFPTCFGICGTPPQPNAFSAVGGTITQTRSGPGTYQVTFQGMGNGTAGGNVQVTPHDPGIICSASWTTAADLTVDVSCYSTAGTAQDAAFSLLAIF